MLSTKQAIFILGEGEYSFDIMDVITIEKGVKVEPVTSFSNNLKGMINLRGDLIPVYSLRRKFGLKDIDSDENTRFIITNSNGIQTAYEVDKVLEMAEVDADKINEVPSVVISIDTSYMKSVTNISGKLVIMLDSNGILSEEEQVLMKSVIKK